ncbi:MAG: transposase family protein [Actinoallomurus sp.]
MLEINQLADMAFSGLSGLVIDDVTDEGELIRVRARSRQVPVPCPGCAVQTAHVHAWCERIVADVALDGRPVVVNVRVRRLVCRDWRCPRRTFREQVAGVLERYQRRTARLTTQVSAVVRESAGRASARMLPALGVVISRHTALRALIADRHQVHDLLDAGVGLLECARRLDLALPHGDAAGRSAKTPRTSPPSSGPASSSHRAAYFLTTYGC